MRLENSIKNVVVAFICNTITIIIGFIAQKVLINTLGIEYSGLNGVLTNIISMLSMVELGIGSQIIYHLYKPIAENNTTRIKQLMNFYKKCYNTIAVIVFILGLAILPFIQSIIGTTTIQSNIYLIYMLFVLDTVVSYLISYKRSIFYASQKNRYIDLIHICYVVIMNTLQILILILTKNYILFLIIKIICRLIENIVIQIIANKMYPTIMKDNNEKIDKNTVQDIKKRVKALIFHQVGGYLVLGTDSIIISKFLGLTVAGIYANYNLIMNAVNIILSQMFSTVTGSIGDLLVNKDYSKAYLVYKKMMFLNFWIFGLATIGLCFTINPLISICFGSEYTFSGIVVFILALNFYFQGMRRTMQTFASAGGICYENRFIPLIEAVVNLVASIILVIIIGLPGVFIGTILSTMVLHFYSFPKYIYSKLFNRKKSEYIVEFIKYFLILIIAFCLSFTVIYFVNIDNLILGLLMKIIFCMLIVNTLFYIMFRKTDEFKYYIDITKKIFLKLKNKIKKI